MLDLIENFASIDQPPVDVNPKRCLHARDRFATCTVCVDACPVDALALGDTITLDHDACAACGLCLHLCPVGAFTGDTGAPDVIRCYTHLAARPGDARRLTLVCAQHPDPGRTTDDTQAVIRTPGCLGGLGPSLYVSLAALGVEQITVRLDACAECPLAACAPHIRQTVDKAQILLRGWRLADRVSVLDAPPPPDSPTVPVYDAQHPPISRRAVLTMFSADRQAATDALLDVHRPDVPLHLLPASAKIIPQERRQLLTALSLLDEPQPQALAPAPAPGQAFTWTGIQDSCTACGVCAQACPTGALQLALDEDRGRFELSFLAGICSGCETCLHLCDSDAIFRRPVPFLSQILEPAYQPVHSGAAQFCEKCGATYAGPRSASGLCPPCDFRRKNPFGYRIPAKLRDRVPSRLLGPDDARPSASPDPSDLPTTGEE